MRSDYYYRQEALKESFKSSYKFSLGAVIVRRGKIVGRGCNYVCYQGGRKYLNGTHAEIAALNDTQAYERTGSTVYVARWRKSQTLGCAKPCGMCQSILRKKGIKTVWYSDYGNVWRKLTL